MPSAEALAEIDCVITDPVNVDQATSSAMSLAEVRAEIDRLMVERRAYFAGYLLRHRIAAQEVDDLLHDGYIIAVLKAHNYRGFGTVTSWIIGILRYLMLRRVTGDRQYCDYLMLPLSEFGVASRSSALELARVVISIDVELLRAKARLSDTQTSALSAWMLDHRRSNNAESKAAHHAVRKLRAAAGLCKSGQARRP